MTTTALSEALAKLRQLKVPNWPAGRILGDIADEIESALASAEPVAWYAPSIDDTCTAAKKAQRERDLPELARLFAVPLHTHPSPAHAGAGAEAVSESAMMEYARGKGWPVTLHKYVPVGDGTWYHNFDITIPTHELAKFFPARRLAGGDHA